jgi:hypothetical protein
MSSSAQYAERKSKREDDETSSDARSAKQRGKKRKKRSRFAKVPYQHKVDLLIAATEPLLALFAVADAVFTEDNALTTEKQKSLGRLYEEWQRCRKAFDPDFVASDYRQPRRWTPTRNDG